MNKKNIGWSILAVAIFAGAYILVRQFSGPAEPGKYDDFARCLSDKGAVMYGAYWCSHCQSEKSAFDSSFQYVNYVECTQDAKTCAEKKISGYPTWIFPEERRFEGKQGLVKLSQTSGCSLPATGQ